MGLSVPRYWVHFGLEIGLWVDGFMPDPGSEWGKYAEGPTPHVAAKFVLSTTEALLSD
jgi:hypothetical protein